MQRCWQRLGRPLLSAGAGASASSSGRRVLLLLHRPVASPAIKSILSPVSNNPSLLGFTPSLPPFAVQARHFAAKDRSRAPATPVTSKVKKYKLKAYSSFKFRFRMMNDGQIRRWRAGKRHNAHLKSKKSKRRLRKPEIVHPAYAKVLKKLNFCG